VLKVPCLTLRDSTERPSTVREGSSVLVGNDSKKLLRCADRILAGRWKKSGRPKFWDGRAAERIARVLASRPELRGR
jgi:UDP-N-acetylglucosamine 2-epimerase (non-hydrolysing)